MLVTMVTGPARPAPPSSRGGPVTASPYAGAGLHGVAQVAAEVAGLVLALVATGQLGQALRR